MANTIKQRRLESLIRKDISDIVQFDLKDPDVGLVTITDVHVSNDHSYATVYCAFYGREERAQAGLNALSRAKGYIRSQLSQMLDIRRCPDLTFAIDRTEEQGRRIDDIIAEIHKKEEQK